MVTTGVVCTLSNDTFTTKTGGLVGLSAMTPATVTGCTFNVAGTSWGISAAANVTVTGSTFTNVAETTDTYLGNGILLTGGAANAISTSTFTGLTNALTVNGGTAMANFFNNTVTNCGEASRRPSPQLTKLLLRLSSLLPLAMALTFTATPLPTAPTTSSVLPLDRMATSISTRTR